MKIRINISFSKFFLWEFNMTGNIEKGTRYIRLVEIPCAFLTPLIVTLLCVITSQAKRC